MPRIGAVFGLAGPLIYAAVIATIGYLHDGYDHALQTMSELGAPGAPYALVMNTAGLPLLGLSTVMFAFGLHAFVGGTRWGGVGPLLLVVSGLSLVLAAVFPCDPRGADVTLTGQIHAVCAALSASFLMLALPILFLRFRQDPRWKGIACLTLATGLLTLAVLVPYALDAVDGYKGALQRATMAIPTIWVMAISVRILLLGRHEAAITIDPD